MSTTKTTNKKPDAAPLHVALTEAEHAAFKASPYGEGKVGNRQFIDDLLADSVIPLTVGAEGSTPNQWNKGFPVTAQERTAIKAMAEAKGLSVRGLIRNALFGAEPSIWDKTETAIGVVLTASQHAAYEASSYGEVGGGRCFIADLLGGTVQRLAVEPGGDGKRAKAFDCSRSEREAIKELAAQKGVSVSHLIRHALFGVEAIRRSESKAVINRSTAKPKVYVGVLLTAPQRAAYDASPYGQGKAGNRQFIADLLGGTVQELVADSGHESTRAPKSIPMGRDEYEAIKELAAQEDVNVGDLIRHALFGVVPIARTRGAQRKVENIALTEAQRAAYDASVYGAAGGGRRFIADLLSGQVQQLSVEDTGGRRRAKVLALRDEEGLALQELATQKGMTKSDLIRSALFGEQALLEAK